MPVQLLNPEGLPQPEHYVQVAVATGSRTVYLSGQVARDGEGNPVGPGDLAAQVEQAYSNVATALAAVGGTFDDVAKLTVYVVDWSPRQAGRPGRGRGAGGAATRRRSAQADHAAGRRLAGRARPARGGGGGRRAGVSAGPVRNRRMEKSAPGRIRTCAPASGGQCSIP